MLESFAQLPSPPLVAHAIINHAVFVCESIVRTHKYAHTHTHTHSFHCALCLQCAAKQRSEADEAQKAIRSKSHRIAEEQKECKTLEELARADLATVEPALNEAIKVVIMQSLFIKNIARFQAKLEFPTAVRFNSSVFFPLHIVLHFYLNLIVMCNL